MFPDATDYSHYFLADGATCDEFEISNAERQASFFAHLSHESLGLTRLEENLRYTAAQLRSVWPFRFGPPKPATLAQGYVDRGPHAIASYVYSGRMGNGTEKSSDGWTYRGRGFIQLTGRNNYAEFAKALGIPLVEKPELAAWPVNAARIAGRYWQTRGCNEKADALDIRGVTRAINGGLTGLNARTVTWQRFRTILGLKELS